MNYLLHRQKFPNKELKLPDGLADLMGDITREIFRSQPSRQEVYFFIANYVEALQRTRDRIQITKLTLDEIIETSANIAESLQCSGITLEKANEAVEVIKSTFQRSIDQKRKEKYGTRVNELKEAEVIANLVKQCNFTQQEILITKPSIQLAYRKFVENYLKALKGMNLPLDVIDPIARFTMEKYFRDAPTAEKLSKYATVIQAAFRGYVVRKSLKELEEESKVLLHAGGGTQLNADEKLRNFKVKLLSLNRRTFEEYETAALTIQKAFRNSLKLRERSLFDHNRLSSEVLDEVVKGEIIYSKQFSSQFSDHLDSYTDEELDAACKMIQKHYRGYKTRKQYGRVRIPNYSKEFKETDKKVEHAAYIIQQAFKKYIIRKRLTSGGGENNISGFNRNSQLKLKNLNNGTFIKEKTSSDKIGEKIINVSEVIGDSNN